MKQIDKRILQAGIAHIEMFVVGIVALGLVGVLGFVGYNAWQGNNADAASGFRSSPQFCDSLGRKLAKGKGSLNSWQKKNGWGLCQKTCKQTGYKPTGKVRTNGYTYDKCVKTNKQRNAEKADKAALDAKKKACKSTVNYRKTWKNNKCTSKKKEVKRVCSRKGDTLHKSGYCFRKIGVNAIKYNVGKGKCPSGYKSSVIPNSDFCTLR